MDVVTTQGYRITPNLDGRKYTMRAPSHGEYTAVLLLGTRNLRPVPAVINHAIREALDAAGKTDLAEAVSDFEAAVAALQAALATYPPTDDPEMAKEGRQALREARERLNLAEGRFRVAEWAAHEAPEVARLRGLAHTLDQDERLATLAVCLVGWEGPDLPDRPEQITAEWIGRNLPVGDVSRLTMLAQGLVAPTKVIEGN